MPNTHDTLSELFSDIADAIRGKTGGSAEIVADNFPSAISSIKTTKKTKTAVGNASADGSKIDVVIYPGKDFSEYRDAILFLATITDVSTAPASKQIITAWYSYYDGKDYVDGNYRTTSNKIEELPVNLYGAAIYLADAVTFYSPTGYRFVPSATYSILFVNGRF